MKFTILFSALSIFTTNLLFSSDSYVPTTHQDAHRRMPRNPQQINFAPIQQQFIFPEQQTQAPSSLYRHTPYLNDFFQTKIMEILNSIDEIHHKQMSDYQKIDGLEQTFAERLQQMQMHLEQTYAQRFQQLQIHLEQTYAQKLQQLQIHLEQTYAQKVTQLEQSQKGRREVSPEYLLSKLGELEAKFNLLNSKTSPLEQHLRTLSETSKTSGAEQKTLREMIQNTKLNLDTLTAKVTDFDKSSMPELMKKIKELETRIQALKTNHPPQETITEEASTPSSTDEVKKKL